MIITIEMNEIDVDYLIDKHHLSMNYAWYVEMNKKLEVDNPDIEARCMIVNNHLMKIIDAEFGGDNNISLVFNDYRIKGE